MNIGDFVKTTKEIYGSPLRQCGLIVGFDTDDDPIVRWFSTGKAWDEGNYRNHLVLCSSVNANLISLKYNNKVRRQT